MNIHWPKIELPDGFGNVESYLRHLVEEGAKNRYGGIDTLVSARMDEELNCLKGYEPYFLILHDIVGFFHANNIFVTAIYNGAPCSIVNYCLGITMADPMRWGLAFEQFLQKIDEDFPCVELLVDGDSDCEETVFYYLEKKYGDGCVSKAYDGYKQVDSSWPYLESKRVHHTNSNSIFLFDEPFEEAVGAISAKEGVWETVMVLPKYSKDILEELGYVHIDINYIDVSNDLLTEIERETDKNIKLEDIPLDDMKTFDVLADGSLDVSFDFNWMTFCREVKPMHEIGFCDFCNIISMRYRSFFDIYVERKKNEDKMMGDSLVSPILKNTLGMVLYQEQIIEILRMVAGMDYKEAEKTRCDLRSHDDKKIDTRTETIMKGCLDRGMTEREASHVLNLILMNVNTASWFSSNVCHALIVYRDAWLRVHFINQYLKLKEKEETETEADNRIEVF